MKGADLWISDAPSRLYHSTGDAGRGASRSRVHGSSRKGGRQEGFEVD